MKVPGFVCFKIFHFHTRIVLKLGEMFQKNFFPTISTQYLCTRKEEVGTVSAAVASTFGTMKVKLVIGKKLFKKSMSDIKTMVENSTHFR